MSDNAQLIGLCDRFCGFYPIVIGVEAAGFDTKAGALLEIAAITLKMGEQDWLTPDVILHFRIEPFAGVNLRLGTLALNGIGPNDPDHGAVSEYEALYEIFRVICKGTRTSSCSRTIMVTHNANFDHSFMMTAAECASLKRNPLHPFATFNTVVLTGLTLGQIVLSKVCQTAGMDLGSTQTHSALHDTERTTVLSHEIANRWKRLGGWPLPVAEKV